MRAASRGTAPAPASLSARSGKDKLTELEKVRRHMAAILPPGQKREAFEFIVYKTEEVKQRLEYLFHGKCAYCETVYASQAPVDVEHYRPKGAVEGEPDHPGYWWLAMEWSNLLPSCIDCNRRRKQSVPTALDDLAQLRKEMQTGKKDSFPIAGTRAAAEHADLAAEEPLLLNPASDDPDRYLTFWVRDDLASGLVLPKGDAADAAVLPGVGGVADVAREAVRGRLSVRGAVSIQVYGLNRLRLVQERARLLQRLRFLESLVVDLGNVVGSLNAAGLAGQPGVDDAIRNLRRMQARILAEMQAAAAPEAPYSAMAKEYLSDFKRRSTEVLE